MFHNPLLFFIHNSNLSVFKFKHKKTIFAIDFEGVRGDFGDITENYWIFNVNKSY